MPDDNINVLENAQLIKELRKKNKRIGEAVKEIRHVICFLLFLFLFTYLVLVEKFTVFYSFEKSVRDRFDNVEGNKAAGGALQLSEVQTVSNLWDYLNTTVIDSLYYDSMVPNATYEILKLDSNSYNLVTGRTRIRTLRVIPNTDCKISEPGLSAEFPSCYGAYSTSSEATDTFTTFTLDGENDKFEHLISDTGAWSGVLADYSANGYMKFLDWNYTDAKVKLQRWRNLGWFDSATRAVFVDFNIWNANVGYYGATKLVFEISPSGKFVNTFDFTVVTDRYIKPDFDTTMILEMCLCLFVAYYIAQELSELTISKSDYLNDGWNLVDWLNLILLLAVTILRLFCFSAAGSSIIDDISNQGVFADLTEYAYYIGQIHRINAFNAVLVWFKIVKYVGFIPYVTTMMSTIKYSWKYFVSFMVFFLTIFVGFSLALTSGFGDKLTNLSSFSQASLFLGNSLVGSSDFGPIYEMGPILAGLILFLFIVLVFFIMLNLFIAVMVVALSSAKAQDIGDSQDSAWAKFVDRAIVLKNMAAEQLNVENNMQLYAPGLYLRRKNRRDAHQELILRRQQRKNILDMRKRIALGKTAKYDEGEDDGGPSSPLTGRMKVDKGKKGISDPSFANMGNATSLPLMMPMEAKADDVEFTDSEESDIDIGILSNAQAKKRKKKMASGEATESELIFQSVQHIATMLARRTDSVKLLVLNEMKDVKMICGVVADVVEILGRRAADLAKQQQTFIDRLGY